MNDQSSTSVSRKIITPKLTGTDIAGGYLWRAANFVFVSKHEPARFEFYIESVAAAVDSSFLSRVLAAERLPIETQDNLEAAIAGAEHQADLRPMMFVLTEAGDVVEEWTSVKHEWPELCARLEREHRS